MINCTCSLSDDDDTLVAVGGSCSIQCDVGYKPLNGNGTLYCLPNGSWSHQAECVLVTCDAFVAPYLVNVSCSGSTFNSVCTLSCWNRVALAADFQYICNSNSQWVPIGNELNCNQVTGTVTAAHVATTVITTTVSLLGNTMPTSSSRNSPNGGVIAGSVVAAVLFMGLLVVAIVIMWWCRKRLGGALNLSIPSRSKICF